MDVWLLIIEKNKFGAVGRVMIAVVEASNLCPSAGKKTMTLGMLAHSPLCMTNHRKTFISFLHFRSISSNKLPEMFFLTLFLGVF